MLDHIGVGGRDFTEYLSTSAVDLFDSPTYGSTAAGSQRNGQSEASRSDLKG